MPISTDSGQIFGCIDQYIRLAKLQVILDRLWTLAIPDMSSESDDTPIKDYP